MLSFITNSINIRHEEDHCNFLCQKSDQKCYFTAGDSAKKVYASAWKQGQEHQPMQKSRSKIEPEMLYIFCRYCIEGACRRLADEEYSEENSEEYSEESSVDAPPIIALQPFVAATRRYELQHNIAVSVLPAMLAILMLCPTLPPGATNSSTI